MSKIHELKTDSDVFQALLRGNKTYEIRKDDRGFSVGDKLLLRETAFTGAEMACGMPLEYTGLTDTRKVTHILRGPRFGLEEGWVIMSVENPRIAELEEREAALAAYIEGLKPALEDFANGLGTCCCGDDMSRHGNPMAAGHMPTDSGWYAMERYMRAKPDTSSLANLCSSKQEEALERLGQLLQETHFDKAPSVARVVMQVNDAINRVKQEVRPLRLVSQGESEPHPDCELECGAYGTYCKCNDEAANESPTKI